MSEGQAHVRGVTIDVSDLERSERFWSGILGLEVSRRIDQYSYFDRAIGNARLILQEVPDEKSGKNRLHLDLATDDPDELLAQVVSLGGRILRDVREAAYELTVASDPDGNEFCVARRLSAGLGDADG